MGNGNFEYNEDVIGISTFRTVAEKLIWSVCLNYASEQISIGKACELLNCTIEEFRKVFETFPYDQKPITTDEVRWLT